MRGKMLHFRLHYGSSGLFLINIYMQKNPTKALISIQTSSVRFVYTVYTRTEIQASAVGGLVYIITVSLNNEWFLCYFSLIPESRPEQRDA